MPQLRVDTTSCLGLLHCGECEKLLPQLHSRLGRAGGAQTYRSLYISPNNTRRYENVLEKALENCPTGALEVRE